MAPARTYLTPFRFMRAEGPAFSASSIGRAYVFKLAPILRAIASFKVAICFAFVKKADIPLSKAFLWEMSRRPHIAQSPLSLHLKRWRGFRLTGINYTRRGQYKQRVMKSRREERRMRTLTGPEDSTGASIKRRQQSHHSHMPCLNFLNR